MRELGARAPRLVEPFARSAAARLGRVSEARLAAWMRAAMAMSDGWRGERRAHACLRAGTSLDVIDPVHLDAWCELAPRFGKALDDARFFEVLDPRVGAWSASEQGAWLRIVASFAGRSPLIAATLYRSWPADIDGAAPVLRTALLMACATAAPQVDLAKLERVLPVVGDILAEIPPAQHALGAEALDVVGTGAPAALPGLLPVLPVVLASADTERVRLWLTRGLSIAEANLDAGAAFFALQSRTGQRVLHASSTAASLSEMQGELRKFVQMLSGEPAVPHGVGTFGLRPPLEPRPESGVLTFPDVVDVFDTYEDNARLVRLLAALLAGRRDHGTYADPALAERVTGEDEPPHLVDLMRLTDGYRVACAMRRRYVGIAADIAWAATILLARAAGRRGAPLPVLLDAVLALALHDDATRVHVPAWLAAAGVPALAVLAPLDSLDATADDALAAARTLVPLFEPMPDPDAAGAVLSDLLPLLLEDPGDDVMPADVSPGGASLAADEDASDGKDPAPELPSDLAELQLQLEELLGDDATTPRSLSVEELARLLEAAAKGSLSQTRGTRLEQLGLYVTQLLGKQLGELPPRLPGHTDGLRGVRSAMPNRPGDGHAVFLYDEWDHRISDYRPNWCRLHEIDVAEDAGVFYERTLATHAALVPELRRHFQRVRPELYRILRGLEDGSDFDLGAAVDAWVQRRTRRTPSTKLYTSRVRQERDVATLFLVDLSASTDEDVADAADGRRIIDITREALVLMAAALEEIGDAFAIFGFSGHGREQVEFFMVKAFDERLTPAVKGRIGGMEPHGSTRMGTAIRHAVTKLRGVTARRRHLLLLSDGFPQDLDYGDDRQSHMYGIRDTAAALQEARRAGVRPFCITVDLAGHDYLREMCDPHSYLVIENVSDLPRELPKIYQRLVRSD